MVATAWVICLYACVRYWPGRRSVYELPLLYVCLILFHFKQYLVRGAQFSEGGLNEALMKKKKKKSNKWYNKVAEAQFGLDLKCLFRPDANLLISCWLLRKKKIDFLPCQCTVTVYSYSSLLEFLLQHT